MSEYIVNPDKPAMTETQRRWLSWQLVTQTPRAFGQKGSYAGTVSEAEVKQRRAKNKVARKQRKVNRQNRG